MPPDWNTTIRSHTADIHSNSPDARMTVQPSRATCWRSRRIDSRAPTSTAAVGSSNTSSLLLESRARPTTTFCCWPPLICDSTRRGSAGKTRSRSSMPATAAFSRRVLMMPRRQYASSLPRVMFSKAVAAGTPLVRARSEGMYTAPARTIPGAPPRSSRPATVTVPDVISPTPMAALTNSRKPEPSSPVRPTSSPSAADNDTGPLSFGVVTRSATNTGGPPRRLRSATLAISRVAWSPSSASSTIADCPAISSASMDAVTPLAGWVHSTWPFFRAVKSSQKAVMSVGLWVTTSIVTPVSSLSRRTRSRNLSSSCRGRLDVGSSMTSKSALAEACSWPPAPSSSVTPARIIARATHSMTRSASGSRCTSSLTGRSRPTVAIAARARDRAAAMLMSPSLFRRNEFTSRLSSTDRFSASPRSWNTAATRGLRAGRPCGPSPSTIRYDPWSAGHHARPGS